MRRAIAFLTPFGGAASPDGRTMRWFPLVGAAIGALVGLAWWASAKAWDTSAIPAVIAVAVDLGATGLLHIDGLADSADGLLPHLTRHRRLAVMAEPDVGAFGVAVVVTFLLARFAAFASIAPDIALVAGVWCASRSLMVLATGCVRYARAEGGLASAFLVADRRGPIIVGMAGIVAGGALAAWGAGWAGVASVASLVVAGVGLFGLARARLGGFTGDVLGAAGVVGETVALLVATAKW